jgi:prevent-host-death family protein
MPSKPVPASPTPAEERVPASVFKATCLALMERVQRDGKEIVVTKHGRPIVRVAPVRDEQGSPWGFLAGTVAPSRDIVSADSALWEPSPTDPLSPRRAR